MAKIHFATVTDELLERDIQEHEVQTDELRTFVLNNFNKLAVDDITEIPGVLLIIYDNSICYTRNLIEAYLFIDSAISNFTDRVSVFEFSSMKEVMIYLDTYHAGVDYDVNAVRG